MLSRYTYFSGPKAFAIAQSYVESLGKATIGLVPEYFQALANILKVLGMPTMLRSVVAELV
jgi:hypothetical protein